MEFAIQITCFEPRLVDQLRATFAQRDVVMFYIQYPSEILVSLRLTYGGGTMKPTV